MLSTILFWCLLFTMLYILTHMAILDNGKKTKFFEKKTQRFLYWSLTIGAFAARMSGCAIGSFILIGAALVIWLVNYIVCSNCAHCSSCDSLLCMSFSERNILDRAIIWAIRKFNINHFKNENS